jgi:hypothetical protein
MKTAAVPIGMALCLVLLASEAFAQYKGPKDYFPKNNPVPGVGNAGGGGANPGGAGPAAPGQPANPPAKPKFKDVPLNTQFYFLSDTNRTYAWSKISATTAKNTVNGVTQTINAETPIQR